ncbi:hypothetical protein V8E51_011158 [Hyaloscypha variabilis]
MGANSSKSDSTYSTVKNDTSIDSVDRLFHNQNQQQTRDRCTTFTPFSRLPRELRDKIWTDVCFVPRYIDLWTKQVIVSVKVGVDGLEYRREGYRYYSCNNIPSLLHTCSEARAIGLRHYSLDFSPNYHKATKEIEIACCTPATIYINWFCDFVARGDKARPRVTLDFASFEDSLKLVKEKTFGRDTVVKYDRIWGLEELVQGVKANMIASNKESSSARSLTIIAKIMIPHFPKAEL